MTAHLGQLHSASVVEHDTGMPELAITGEHGTVTVEVPKGHAAGLKDMSDVILRMYDRRTD